tara:strand:+ start:1269 stop:1589 length:321 start_codon:yes stop_codon:yes gene_type:complete
LSVYGRWQFWAAGYDKGSKVSRISNLRQVAKSLGRNPKELDEEPELREELVYLWDLFVSLKNASSGAISYNEINSYMSIYGILSTFEVDIIRSLDILHAQEGSKND